jgi:hypothetical protein
MQRRAESLGGALQVISTAGQGTMVTLKIPTTRGICAGTAPAPWQTTAWLSAGSTDDGIDAK